MALDWKDLGGQLVRLGAPVIGGALLGPFGATLGTTLGGVVADMLGVDATPGAVNDALQNRTPEELTPVLSAADRKAEIELERFKLQLQDVQSARTMTVEYAKADSILQYGAVVVSILVTLGFFSVLFLLLFVRNNISDLAGQVLLILVGTLGAMQTQVVNYWLGSSAGSSDKTAQLSQLAQLRTTPAKVITPAKK